MLRVRMRLWTKGEGLFLYSALSNLLDCSNHFTLHLLAKLLIPAPTRLLKEAFSHGAITNRRLSTHKFSLQVLFFYWKFAILPLGYHAKQPWTLEVKRWAYLFCKCRMLLSNIREIVIITVTNVTHTFRDIVAVTVTSDEIEHQQRQVRQHS